MLRRPENFGIPYQRADGRWVVPYRVAPNQWKPITIPKKEPVVGKQQALEWAAAKILNGRINGRIPKPRTTNDGPSVRELFERWMKLREPDEELSAATISNNKSHFKIHVLPELGDTPVKSFGTIDGQKKIAEFIRKLKGKAGRQTVNNVAATLRTFLDFTTSPEGDAILSENPLRKDWVRNLLPQRHKQDGRFATLDDAPLNVVDVQKLLDGPDVPLGRAARYALAFTSLLRDGEIAGVRIREVHLEAPIPFIEINKACSLRHRDGFAKLGPTKTPWSIRRLPLHQAAVGALWAWLADGWENLVGQLPKPDDPLFPRDDGNFARPSSAAFFRDDLLSVGLSDERADTKLRFHDARGCGATWLVNANVESALVRRFLGHAPVGAAELKYFKGDLLAALAEAQKKIGLVWRR
jgi:integrase